MVGALGVILEVVRLEVLELLLELVMVGTLKLSVMVLRGQVVVGTDLVTHMPCMCSMTSIISLAPIIMSG